jgi:ribosome-binding factor A
MSIRTERLGSVIQKDLGHILQQGYQQSGSIISVTGVRVTPDLMSAKVFISVFAPGKDDDAIFQYLDEQNANIRMELAAKIRHQVRRIPELDFVKDDSAEYAQKMEGLFQKIREERRQRESDTDEEM